MNNLILVTGATGSQGGAVARSLLRRGDKVRAFVRDPNKPAAVELKKLGAELAVGTFDDAGSLQQAMKDVYGVFSVQNFFECGYDQEVAQGKRIADVAKQTEVQHLVYSSVIGADRQPAIPHFDSKWEIEQHIRSIGIKHTILRAVAYMDNFFTFNWYNDGKLYVPIHPNTQWQMIATKDIGEFAALAFAQPDQLGTELEIAGDQFTMAQAAEVFSRVLNRPVQYQEQPMAELRAYSEELAKMFEWFNDRANYADINALRKIHPDLLNLEGWLRTTQIAQAQPAQS